MQDTQRPAAAAASGQQLQQQDKNPKLYAVAASVVVLLAIAWSLNHSSHSRSGSSFQPKSGISVNDTSSSGPFLGVPLKAIQYQQQQQSPEQAVQTHARLQQLRSQLLKLVTTDAVQQLLQGARLPKRVPIDVAQQLVVDAQLLHHSLQEGHAAARIGAIHSHYASSTSSSTSTSRGGETLEAAGAAGPAADTVEAAQAAQQEAAAAVTGSLTSTSSRSSSRSSSSVSRGILIVGGSRTHLGNAYILLRMLRQHLHCRLPIEVVYYGQQELDPAAAALVRDFMAAEEAAGRPRIALIDGLEVQEQHIGRLKPHPEHVKLTSWVAKVHALCWVTSFQQVLLLDSDNLPVQDPEVLFGVPEFTSNGFLIWPDFWHNLWMDPAVYRLLNLSVPWEVNPQGFLAAESGQMLLDRSAHADVLEWLWLLNSHRELVYECVVGDKDTYRMAFDLAGKEQHYVQVSQPPQELLGDAGAHISLSRFFHLGMGQSSPDGKALMFMHRTARGKFFPWCAAKRLLNGTCQPALLTLPVVQEQLQAAVRDAGAMRFDAGKIDVHWHINNCVAAGAGDEAPGRSSSKWSMPLPACNYTLGQLPIVALPPAALPGLPEYLAMVDAVFAEVQQQLQVQLVDRVKVVLGKL
ncbi:mannosyltransferase putative-domain-containing protein [Scenedesmus sp. NREL 46B-D3]|nr:mannosyltransferase putative-domain-containing protein [Scenedesmus sp. NREL 46B-D3]